VHRCHLKERPEKKYAVKIIDKTKLTPRLFHNLTNEINILSKINSPYVIRLRDLQKT